MSNEKLETRSDVLFGKLVPGSGNAGTMEGEMLRAINKIVYRHYNDGDYFFTGYGCETAGPAHSFLIQGCPLSYKLKPIFVKAITYTSDYEKVIYEVLEIILDYIDSRNGDHEVSDVDMYDFDSMFEEEEEVETCWECGEEDNWCECE
tara:strand:- start:46 stop:489 length:444 start_codon:yes stop_codon:yes gene_type:complete